MSASNCNGFGAKELDEMIAAGQNTGRQNDDRIPYLEAISRGPQMRVHPDAGKPAGPSQLTRHPEADHGLLRRPPGSGRTNAACRFRHIGPSRNIVREWFQRSPHPRDHAGDLRVSGGERNRWPAISREGHARACPNRRS